VPGAMVRTTGRYILLPVRQKMSGR
jgi:hypothetical protein